MATALYLHLDDLDCETYEEAIMALFAQQQLLHTPVTTTVGGLGIALFERSQHVKDVQLARMKQQKGKENQPQYVEDPGI